MLTFQDGVGYEYPNERPKRVRAVSGFPHNTRSNPRLEACLSRVGIASRKRRTFTSASFDMLAALRARRVELIFFASPALQDGTSSLGRARFTALVTRSRVSGAVATLQWKKSCDMYQGIRIQGPFEIVLLSKWNRDRFCNYGESRHWRFVGC